MKILKVLIAGVQQSLRGVWYKALFVISFGAVFALFVYIPARSVIGNSFALQLTLFSPLDFGVMAIISILYALFITMQVYTLRSRRKSTVSLGTSVGSAAGSGIGALFAGVAGTAFCASCLAPLFALFGIGFGGVIFVLQYRFYFVAGILIFMLVAIYLTAQKIQKTCNTC